MSVVYKTKIYSADGSTFLRPFMLHVPECYANGGNPHGNGFSYQNEETFGSLCTKIQQKTQVAKIETNWTIFGWGNPAGMAAQSGATNVVNLRAFITPNPAAGIGVRIVFNNNSYILMTIESYVAVGSIENAMIRLDYYTAAGSPVVTVRFKLVSSMDNTTDGDSNDCVPIPFAYSDVTSGTITDPHLRYFGTMGASNQIIGPYTFKFYSGVNYYSATYSLESTNNSLPGIMSDTDMSGFLNGIAPYDPADPYPGVDPSGPSGPADGTGIPASDPVEIPSLPTVSLLNTGFVTLFNPSMTDIKNLADYMWNNNAFDLTNFKKIFANPMDCILGLNMVPVTVPASGSGSVNIGNLTTSVSMPLAASQWQDLDCGTLDLGLPLGNYMDYAPNSKYSIYLPYIGIQELSTDDVAGKTLKLVYHVDLMSCACIAYLKCGNSVLYQFSGSCGYPIPVTENSWNNLYKAIAELAVGVGGAVATGGMSAGGLMNGAVDLIQGLKPEVHRSGAIGSAAGLMGIQKPFLIIEIPNLCKPEKQYHYIGYPSFVTKKLNDISGYASFEEIILENIPCTEEEAVMIKNLCKGGIHL